MILKVINQFHPFYLTFFSVWLPLEVFLLHDVPVSDRNELSVGGGGACDDITSVVVMEFTVVTEGDRGWISGSKFRLLMVLLFEIVSFKNSS